MQNSTHIKLFLCLHKEKKKSYPTNLQEVLWQHSIAWFAQTGIQLDHSTNLSSWRLICNNVVKQVQKLQNI